MKKSSITWHYRASDPEWGYVCAQFWRDDLSFLCSLFQCRQCQDLLENNLARKRPIEGQYGEDVANALC